MIIEINKDIDKYKESVVLGLTAKQLIYSILSVIVGGSVVFLLYPYVGLTVSAYIAIPAVAPIALTGFYSYHGMSFIQKMRLKFHFAFGNKALAYESTEGEKVIQKIRMDGEMEKKKKAKGRHKGKDRSGAGRKEFDEKKNSMLGAVILTVVLCILLFAFAIFYKFFMR